MLGAAGKPHWRPKKKHTNNNNNFYEINALKFFEIPKQLS